MFPRDPNILLQRTTATSGSHPLTVPPLITDLGGAVEELALDEDSLNWDPPGPPPEPPTPPSTGAPNISEAMEPPSLTLSWSKAANVFSKCSQTRPTSEKEIVPDTWSMYLFYSIGKSINSGKVWRVVLRIFIPDPGHWQGSLWEKMHSLPPRQRALAKRISALARSGRFAKSPRSGSGPRPPPRLNMIDWGLHRSEEWVRSGRRWNSGFYGVAG